MPRTRTRTRRHTGKKTRKTTHTRKRPVMTGGKGLFRFGGSKRPNQVSLAKNALTPKQLNSYEKQKKEAGFGSYPLARVNKALGRGSGGLFGLWGVRQAKKQHLIQQVVAQEQQFTKNPAYVPPTTQ